MYTFQIQNLPTEQILDKLTTPTSNEQNHLHNNFSSLFCLFMTSANYLV